MDFGKDDEKHGVLGGHRAGKLNEILKKRKNNFDGRKRITFERKD